MEKAALRQKILKQRLLMKSDEIVRFSKQISDRLLTLQVVQDAACLMAYYPHKNEPDLKDLMNVCLDMDKKVSLPYVLEGGYMAAVDYHENSVMKSNIYGIPEPIIDTDSEQQMLDVVLVPGIVFDESLNRMGFGKGYYDRFLGKNDAVKIGVCYESNIVDNIPTDAHDIKMDIIVTEKRVIGELSCV